MYKAQLAIMQVWRKRKIRFILEWLTQLFLGTFYNPDLPGDLRELGAENWQHGIRPNLFTPGYWGLHRLTRAQVYKNKSINITKRPVNPALFFNFRICV